MAGPGKQATSVLVQYIAVRGDLVDKWPVGAVVAQACHAATAVMHIFRDDPNTVQYLSDLDRMHKIVLKVSYNHITLSSIHLL